MALFVAVAVNIHIVLTTDNLGWTWEPGASGDFKAFGSDTARSSLETLSVSKHVTRGACARTGNDK